MVIFDEILLDIIEIIVIFANKNTKKVLYYQSGEVI